MANERIKLWKEFDCYRENINDVDKDIYLNHVDVKINKNVYNFNYDYHFEGSAIRGLNGKAAENAYEEDPKTGKLVPKEIIKTKKIRI